MKNFGRVLTSPQRILNLTIALYGFQYIPLLNRSKHVKCSFPIYTLHTGVDYTVLSSVREPPYTLYYIIILPFEIYPHALF